MRRWKLDPITGENVLDQFRKDYNLSILEASYATGLKGNTPAFNALVEDPSKADIDFIDRLSKLTGLTESELLENIETEKKELLNTKDLCSDLKKIQKKYLDILSLYKDNNEVNHYKAGVLLQLHKPVISLIGDTYSGKTSLLMDYIPQLKKIKNPKNTIYIFNDDLQFNQKKNHDSVYVVTPPNENFFLPELAIDPIYMDICDIKPVSFDKPIDSTTCKLEDNSVFIIISDFSLLQNCIFQIVPDIKYETEDKYKITYDSLKNLVNYLQYANIIIYADAITRILTVLETPLLQKLLYDYKNGKELLIVATKKELNCELAADNYYISKQNSISNSDKFHPYIGPFSYKPNNGKHNLISINDLQNQILIYNEAEPDLLFNRITSLCEDYFNTISSLYIYYDRDDQSIQDDVNMISESPSIRSEKTQLDDGKNEIKKAYVNAINIESMEHTLEEHVNEFSLSYFIDFIQNLSNSIIDNIDTDKNQILETLKLKDKIIPESNLFIGNILIPFILREKYYSKGKPAFWAKKFNNELAKNISSEKNVSNIYTNFIYESIESKLEFGIRNPYESK